METYINQIFEKSQIMPKAQEIDLDSMKKSIKLKKVRKTLILSNIMIKK
jgi:translation elongation factor EF-1beta